MKNSIRLTEARPVFTRVRQEPKQRVIKSTVLNLLIFLSFEIINQMTQAVILNIAMIPALIRAYRETGTAEIDLSSAGSLLLMLFLTAVCIALCFVYCLAIEHRSIRSMGLTRKKALSDYLIGAGVGILMMSAAVLISWAGGGLSFSGTETRIPFGYMLAFLCAWMIQGFSEELNFRGYFMMTVGTHHSPLAAVGISSVLFSAAHLFNDGISFFAVCNLTLFGLFAALYFLRTDSIFGVAALHSMWNAAQGNLFGLNVSGIEIPATIFRFVQNDGHTWLNGGAFGPEGGAAVTLVLAVGIAAVFFLPQRTVDKYSSGVL